MYIINIMDNFRTIYQLKEERLQILFGKMVEIRDWNLQSLKASFWRCYCPLDKGGIIIYRGKEIPLLPGKGFIIPPLTDFSSKNSLVFSKLFCHFAYEIRDLAFTPGIYEFKIPEDLDKNLRQQKAAPEKINFSTVELMMMQLVSLGLANIPESAKQELKLDDRIQGLLEFISKNKTSVIKNSDLAKRVKLTVPSMIRLFKSNLGTSPQKYQMTLRIRHAGSLLVHTDRSLEEIAEACGFWDRNHFTRAFTSFLGVPPATYRKLNKR